jgi:hypothetical protein
MKNIHLSKSDFIMADECLAKLYFRKNGYPSNAHNAYSDYLARIGHIVGYIAKETYGPGEEIRLDQGVLAAVEETEKWIKKTKNGVLFEATFLFDQRLVRVDVLKKSGKKIELIEVKSSGFDNLEWESGPKEKKKILTATSGKISDLAFQTAVLERALPDYNIEPYLCFVDKNIINEVEGLYGNFTVQHEAKAEYSAVTVDYHGDVEELMAQFLLTPEISFKKEVNAIKEDVWSRSTPMVDALAQVDDFEKFRSPRKMACARCEYKWPKDTTNNGYELCWGKDAFANPHILSIRKDAALSKLLNPLVSDGLAKISDVPSDLLSGAEGPKLNGVPLLQAEGAHEYINPKVQELLGDIKYPLFFIDFETIRPAIPFHQGMMPYRSVILFQWSCHKIATEGSPVEHFEFLNTEPSIPNTEFIESLREVLGDSGTVITWSSFENAQLKQYLIEQLELDAFTDSELIDWLSSVLKEKDGGWRQLDLHDDVVKKYYYHEMMGSRTSIKAVLPAVLSESQPQVNIELLKSVGLYKESESGKGLIDPYKLLAGVSDGTQAMTAYEELHFGKGKTDERVRSRLVEELLAYCRLDTLSMVLLFNYLRGR